MSFGSWLKNTLFEKEGGEVKEDIDGSSVMESNEVKNYDYHLSVFDLSNKQETGRIISYILQDKKLALVKTAKFNGNHEDLKQALNELKETCKKCNSRIVGLNNSLYLITKNTIYVEKIDNS